MSNFNRRSFVGDLYDENNVNNNAELKKVKERIDKIESQPLYYFKSVKQEQISSLFKKGDADFALLKSLRHRYLHLSAQGGLVDSPAKNNIRLIIDDSK